jgi:hypothetical protein
MVGGTPRGNTASAIWETESHDGSGLGPAESGMGQKPT